MDDSNKSALESLEQLRRERDDLNILIEGIEKAIRDRICINASAIKQSGPGASEGQG